MLVPLPQEHFRLLDLPPEIRTLIYKHLFAPSKHYKTVSVFGNFTKTLRGMFMPAKLPIVAKEIGKRPGLNRNVLLVSRQVYQEAVAVFYSSREFRFKSGKTLVIFLDVIGSQKTYLRHISAWCSTGNMLRNKALPMLLAGAEHLTCFDTGAFKDVDAEEVKPVAYFLEPMLDMLFAKEKDFEKVFKVMNFTFPDHCDIHRVGGVREAVILSGSAHCSAVRASSAMQLARVRRCILDPLMERVRKDIERPRRSAVAARKISYADIDEEEDVAEQVEARIDHDGRTLAGFEIAEGVQYT